MTQRRIAVAGATGAIGTPLTAALVARGHQVTALTRSPDRYDGAGEPRRADVLDRDEVQRALEGHPTAYYLVHSLDRPDFAARDAEAARTFAAACVGAGVRRIVYLGGLGQDGPGLSEHLRSRREVEVLLGGTGLDVAALRAAVVVGPGSISWALIRRLATVLPVLTGPHLTVPTQPIALRDVLDELVLLGENTELTGAFETGGPDVLGYGQLVRRAARIITGRAMPMVPFPVPTSLLPLVTDLDPQVLGHLVESLSSPTVVTHDRLAELRDRPRLGYDDAVRLAESTDGPP